MQPKLRTGFRLGLFHVDPLSGDIEGPDGTAHLQPKVMDVLVCLAESAGVLVERDTILEQVWGRATSEEVLTRCISELRSALADERGRPEYIQTVPKRGYRLLMKVEPDGEPAASGAVSERPPQEAARPTRPPPPGEALASVAVLPFENLSDNSAYRHLGDAFAAELYISLARVDRLRVAARRSCFALKDSPLDVEEIGRQLNVRYVITGSIQVADRKLRLIVELGDAATSTQIWAQSYDRSPEDILALERELAESVVSSVAAQAQRAEMNRVRTAPTESLDAWGLVQKARSLALEYTAETLTDAIAPIERAISLDPNYAAAHASLASLLVDRLVNGLSDDPAQDEERALRAAERALTLAPVDPFILKLIGLVWVYSGNSERALTCLRDAVRLAPFDFGTWGYFGWPLTARGSEEDLAELQDILKRLLRMQPRHPGVPFWLFHQSVASTIEGDYEQAENSVREALRKQPDFALSWLQLANVLGHGEKRRQGREAVERGRQINPAMTVPHFRGLIEKISANQRVAEARSGGLRYIQ